MAQVVVANFATLTEAQIVAGALNSGGLHAVVADQHYGSAVWFEQRALQGFRVMVPEGEAADARAYLAEADVPPPRDPASALQPGLRPKWGWRALAVVLLFLLGAPAAWLAVGGLRRGTSGYVGAALMTIGLVAVAVLAVAAAVVPAGALWASAFGRVLIGVAAVVAVGWLMRRVEARTEADRLSSTDEDA